MCVLASIINISGHCLISVAVNMVLNSWVQPAMCTGVLDVMAVTDLMDIEMELMCA